jgi:hypothetical protein
MGRGAIMTTQEALDTLDWIDDLFGSISNSFVQVCEELPSMGLTKEMEARIVHFCCTSLEQLVEEDKRLQEIMRSLKGNTDRVPRGPSHAPGSATQIIATAAQHVGVVVQSIHGLAAEYKSLARQQPALSRLEVLLSDSGASIENSFAQMRNEFDALLAGWEGKEAHT